MQVQVMAKTFRSVGKPPFSIAGAILDEDCPSFGAYPDSLWINPHFHDVMEFFGTPDLLKEYNARLLELPKIRIRKKKQILEIDYLSKVCMGEDFIGPKTDPLNTPFGLAQIARVEAEFGPHPPARPYDANLLREFCEELIKTLRELKGTLTKKIPEFNLDLFIDWAAEKFEHLPTSDETVESYFLASLERYKNRLEQEA